MRKILQFQTYQGIYINKYLETPLLQLAPKQYTATFNEICKQLYVFIKADTVLFPEMIKQGQL